jgi:serine/threonine protein kinase
VDNPLPPSRANKFEAQDVKALFSWISEIQAISASFEADRAQLRAALVSTEAQLHAANAQLVAQTQAALFPLQPVADAALALEEARALCLQLDWDSLAAAEAASKDLQEDFEATEWATLLQHVRDAEASVLRAAPGASMNEAAGKRDKLRQEVTEHLRIALGVGTLFAGQLGEEWRLLQPLCGGDGLDGEAREPVAGIDELERVWVLREKTVGLFSAISSHHQLMGKLWADATSSVPSRAPQDAIVVAGKQLATLKTQLQQANVELQAAVSLLRQCVRGARRAAAQQLAARWSEVEQLNHSANEQVDALRMDLVTLEGAIAAGAKKEEAIKSVKDALNLLEGERLDLEYAQRRVKLGRAVPDAVAKSEKAVADARFAYNQAARELLQISLAGHPEIQLGAVSRQQSLLETVPTISASELTALGGPDDSNLLGVGAVSSVHRLALVNGDVAFKKFKGNVGRDEMLREANALWGLHHHNIVQLLMVCLDEGNMGIVLELMDTSLYAVLHQHKAKPPMATLLLYMCDVTAAVAYLHEHKTMHLDLKSANVLLRGGVAKVADFGTTKVVRETIHLTSVALSSNWCCPEYLKDASSPKPAADVWSLGMVLYEMCTGAVPYEIEGKVEQPGQVMVRVLGGELPVLPDTVEPLCSKWMTSCWLREAERITAHTLHGEIKAAMSRDCLVCDSSFLLGRGGAQCDAGKHWRCSCCLQQLVEDALADGLVRADGALVCLNCGHYALASFRELLPKALCARWQGAATVQDFVAGEQALRERRRAMQPVNREVERIQRKLLGCACPHCGELFAYEGANHCLALHCERCSWYFCAYCFECFGPNEGGPAHDHVSVCGANPTKPEIFFPGQHSANAASRKSYFEFVQRCRIKRALLAYLQRIQPASLREAVKAKLAPDLQRLNLVL